MSWITVLKKHVLRCMDCTFDSVGSWIFINLYLFVQLLYFYFFFWLFKENVTAQNAFCSLNIYLRPKKSVTWHRTLLGLGIEVYKKLQSLFPWIRFITMDCFRVMETGLSWVFYHQLGMTSYIGRFWNLFGSFSVGDIIFIQRDMTVNLRLSSKHY